MENTGCVRTNTHFIFTHFHISMWAEKDSNLRTRERTDLQSVAFSHSAIYPLYINLKKNPGKVIL